MITEDYVSYETAKLLKEKGFDIPYNSFRGVYINGVLLNPGDGYRFNYEDEIINVCSLQTAMKWLREVHHYYIQVMLDSWAYGGHMGYYVIIQKTNSEFEIMLSDKIDKVFYDEPEEACEEAIKYCLENLI